MACMRDGGPTFVAADIKSFYVRCVVYVGSEVFPIEKDHEGSVAGKLEKYHFADYVLVQGGRGVV